MQTHMTYVGGPTALVEVGPFRLLTDPTFDAAGGEYRTPSYSLFKLDGPAVPLGSIGRVDAVLLSHDHHFDNLDHLGRQLLSSVPAVLTTTAGAARLGGNAVGLEPWQSTRITHPGGATLSVTATPARHGPPQADRGPVIGFALQPNDEDGAALYLSGDTVWYDGVREVARRFHVGVAVLFMGAAQVDAAGPWPLTFTAAEGVEAANAFERSLIVPLHYEGWGHFKENRPVIERAFEDAGLTRRLVWLPPGERTELTTSS